MGFHDVEFLGAQFAGLEQDIVRYGHLADIVQRRGVLDAFDKLVGYVGFVRGVVPELFSQHPAIFPHPFQVRTGIAITLLGKFGQSENRCQLGIGYIFDLFFQHLMGFGLV